MNGKSIEVDNTDAEGRLVLAGELYWNEAGFAIKLKIWRRYLLYRHRV